MKVFQGFPSTPVPLHQAINDRLLQVDLDAARLTRRYCEYLRSLGDTKAIPNNRRQQIVNLLCPGTDSSLKTIFGVISCNVLNGQFLLCTETEHFGFANSAEMSRLFKAQMNLLGISVYELTRRYCLIKALGERSKVLPLPDNHLGIIKGLLDSSRNPRFSSLVYAALAFEGTLYIRWKSTQRRSIKSSNLALKLMPVNTDITLEYPIYTNPLRVK